ncbi:MAG: RHS repeat-associated core domain-containing protein, partial [Acidobacteriota bacterium]|nr:RHS repeat-associated core domain-containing protein [Acidobacteriota bacterium]
ANNVLNTITFRASGALRQLNYGNGRRLTMGYNDNRNQPTSMVVDRTNNSADKVVDYAYQYYDANGKNNNRIRQITDNIETAYSTTYTYDNYNRLTNATANAFSRNYQHDPFGNITNFSGLTLNYQTNSSGAPTTNRIDTDSQSYSYTYDSAGNMTVGAGQSYSYDGANRLKTASTGTSSYGYDGDGKRVKKTENGATTYYVFSSKLGQSVMEVTASSVQRAYVYNGNKLVAMQATDGQFYWLHTNHLGNSRAMTDGSGNLTYKGHFDPYGATLTEWSGSGNTNLNSKKFTGYERDSATGLDYAQARMYNSSRGRFMTPDPIGLEGADQKRPRSLNRYSYVEGDPVNFNDPSGTFLNNPWCSDVYWDGFLMGNTCGYGFWGDLPLPLPWPSPEPEPEPKPITTCTVTLGSRGLDYTGLDRILHHMFITTRQWSTDPDLNKVTPTVFQGTHEGAYLRVRENPFVAGNEDYDNSRSSAAIFVSVEFAGTCDEVNASFRATMGKINDANIKYEVPYFPTNPFPDNSNAAAFTLLENWSPVWRAVLYERYREKAPRPVPIFAPGWGNNLLSR